MFSDISTNDVFALIILLAAAITSYLGGAVIGKKIVKASGKEPINYDNAVMRFKIALRCTGLLGLVAMLAKAAGAL